MYQAITVDQARSMVRQLERICTIRDIAANIMQLSNCYFVLGETEKSLKLAYLAYEKDSNSPAALVNLGLIMNEVGEYAGALNCFQTAVNDLKADDWYTRLAYSEALLRFDRWEEAWPIYDTCRPTKEGAALAASIPTNVKEWDGKRNPESLIVLDEGGVGDRFTYTRWFTELDKRGINWRYFAMPDTLPFYQRMEFFKDRLAKDREPILSTHWTTIVSLPANLNAREVPKFPEPITPDIKLKLKFKPALGVTAPMIGLCWSGEELRNGGRKVHSLSEGEAMRLVSKTDHMVRWVNLNHADSLPYPVENPRINNLEELAGLMSNLTEIISIDSGPAFMASAMELPLTVLLPTNTDWKFGIAEDEVAFLPGAKIIRNGPGGGMEKTVEKAIEHVNRKYSMAKRIHLA